MPSNCCFKGRGEIAVVDYAQAIKKTAGLMAVGNASLCQVNLSERKENVRDYTSSAGGMDCSSREVDEVEVALTLLCSSAENLAMGLYGVGASDNVATAAVASEQAVAWPGAIVPLADLADQDVAIVVKNIAGSTTYTAGTDYEVTQAGSIRLLPGTTIPSPTVSAGVGQPNIAITYTRKKQSLVQLVRRASKPVLMHFDGINIMDGNRNTYFQLFRVIFGPAKSFSAISDNVSQIELVGTVTKDPAKPAGTAGAPLSQYGTLRI